MSITGFLTLGTYLSGSTVVTPPSGTNYSPQPIVFDVVSGGISLNSIACTFGPVSGASAAPWGTLSVFGVTDSVNNPYWSGTLATPFTPVSGQSVVVSQGSMSLVVGTQLSAQPTVGTIATPYQGPTTSGSVVLSSAAYTAVLASGARHALLLSNTSQTDSIRVLLGGASAPASGASGYSVIPPFGTWPPNSIGNFVPTDSVWALCGSGAASVLSYFTG